MKLRRSRLTKLAGTAALLAMAVAIWLSVTAPRPVLAIARRFCQVEPWSRQTLYPSQSYHRWISDSEVLVILNEAAGGLYRVKLDANGTPGPAVSAGTKPGAGIVAPVSPNGRYLAQSAVSVLQPSAPAGGAGPGVATPRVSVTVHVTELGGTPVRSFTCAGSAQDYEDPEQAGRLAWSPDSRTLYLLLPSGNPALTRLHIDSGQIEALNLPPELGKEITKGSSLLGCTSHGSLLIAPDGPTFASKEFYRRLGTPMNSDLNWPILRIDEVSTEQRVQVVRRYSPRVPTQPGVGTVVVSPSGDRIFWGAICAEVPSAIEVWLHRVLPFARGALTAREVGWVSTLDGSGAKEIGFHSIPDPPAAGAVANLPQGPPWVLDPQWTPDGKRISFVFRDGVYTVPAE